MNTENDRIKELRISLGLTLEKFGQKLGVTKVAISNIENGHRNVTHQMRLSIVREFGVNETWLRTGVGEMFLNDELRRMDAFQCYLESLGFTVSMQVSKWHWEDPEETDPSKKVQVEDEYEVELSKEGRTATFTEAEYEDLQAKSKDAIEGSFYKKILFQ